MRLVINGFDIELAPDVKIARTLQVNDIGSVSTRQASYTNTFSIPRTSNNVKTFNMLGVIGNESNIPYQKNECDLYSDSGETIVYRGWAVITSTDKDFKCNIYDGIIDLFKAIENKSLADLNLQELNHEKNMTTVTGSQDLSKPYVYIFADYNGKAQFSSKINIDYLVPSVKVSWLLSKIEEFTGFQINGSFKTNPDFTNLYITYPKGTPPVLGASILTSTDIKPNSTSGTLNLGYSIRSFYVTFNTTSVFNSTKLAFNQFNNVITALEDVKFNASFKLSPFVQVVNSATGTVKYIPYARFNNQEFYCGGSEIILNQVYSLSKGQSIYFDFEVIFQNPEFSDTAYISDFFTSCDFKELDNAILFEEEFGGMQIKQFLSEILWQYNLTIFKDKYSDSYTLKYLSEILDSTSVDWSDKFQSLDSESYIYGVYAQRNWLRYKYNDENSFYNDSYIDIENNVLSDSKNVISSSLYTPDYNGSSNIGFPTNIYRLWNKEVKDNGTIDYKTLANRYYFIRATQTTGTYNLISESLSSTGVISNAQIENYVGLNFTTLRDKYYSQLTSLLNKSKIQTASLRLNERDVLNMDFSKPVYIKQLGGSFLVNKISNFTPFKDTKVELVKINTSFIDAKDDIFYVISKSTQQLNVLENDFLNAPSANITSINNTGFTLGTLAISSGSQSITFTPNGTNGTSTFKYTITNSLGIISEAIVTINTNIPAFLITTNSLQTEATTTTFTREGATTIIVNVPSKSFMIGVKKGFAGVGTITGQIIINGQTINVSNTGTSYYYSAPFTLTEGVYNSSTFKVTATYTSGFAITGFLTLIPA